MLHSVGASGGESVGAGDAENPLLVRLKQRIEQIPSRHDDAVVELARLTFDPDQSAGGDDDTIGRRVLVSSEEPSSDFAPLMR